MTHKIEAHACDYCKRIFSRLSDAKNHENNHCNKSPIARRCKGCKNLILFREEISCDKGIQLINTNSLYLNMDSLTPIHNKIWRKHCSSWEINVNFYEK